MRFSFRSANHLFLLICCFIFLFYADRINRIYRFFRLINHINIDRTLFHWREISKISTVSFIWFSLHKSLNIFHIVSLNCFFLLFMSNQTELAHIFIHLKKRNRLHEMWYICLSHLFEDWIHSIRYRIINFIFDISFDCSDNLKHYFCINGY